MVTQGESTGRRRCSAEPAGSERRMDQSQPLVPLLVRVGAAASIAGFGVRSEAVKRMLLREERTLAQRSRLALWFAIMFLPGVAFRVVAPAYSALDLALEGAFLAGITGGDIW